MSVSEYEYVGVRERVGERGCVFACSIGLGKGGEKGHRVLGTFLGKHRPWHFP